MSLKRVLFALLGAAAAATTIKDCAPGTSVFTMHDAKLNPATPAPGSTVSLTLSYTVPEGVIVRGGTTEYDVSVNFIPMSPYTEPLCQDIPCPLGPGLYTNTTQSTWPSGITGFVTNKMYWKGVEKETLLCLQISSQMGTAAAAAAAP